jgi:hypothetical protein
MQILKKKFNFDLGEIWWQGSGGVAISFEQKIKKKLILKICDFSGIFFLNDFFFFFFSAFSEFRLSPEHHCHAWSPFPDLQR